MAREYFQEAVEIDERKRQTKRPDDPQGLAAVLDCVSDDWLDRLKFNDMHEAEEIVDAVLATRNLKVEKRKCHILCENVTAKVGEC